MPTYLHPGVYIEEISGGARPIEAVGTSTAAFVGIAEKGPIDETKFITNFSEFRQIYGDYESDNNIGKSYLAYSVNQFFQNGGSSCYVVRVEDGAESAEVDLYTAEGIRTITVKAISPGSWGNDLRIAIGEATTSETGFNLYVLSGDEIVETYEDCSMVDNSIFFVDRLTKRSIYIRTESNSSLSDNPTVTGNDLSSGVNLQNVKRINLQIDSFGPYIIDCSENAPVVNSVSANVIRDNINKAFENDISVPVASVSSDNEVIITSPTADDDSQIIFTAPGNQDATNDIFGLQESSWNVKGGEETLAMVPGLDAPDTSAGRSLTLTIGTGSAVTSTINASDTVYTITETINDDHGDDVAFTDGVHLLLMSSENISIQRTTATQRTDIEELFGSDFYSYVTTGSGANPATITGVSIVGAVTGQMRLSVDNVRTFEVDFDGESTADAIAKSINKAYQKVSKSEKKIANSDGTTVTLTSVTAGANGRIIVSSHTGTDITDSVLDSTSYQNDNDFVIPAVTQWVSRVDGTPDFVAPATIGANLAGAILRMSAGGNPVQFTISSAAGASAETLFTADFGPQTALNHSLLLSINSTESHINMIAASVTDKPQLHFSIPLVAGEITAHISDPTADTHTAYAALFGNQSPFDTGAHIVPDYTYIFLTPDNNPVTTIATDGEEYDFSASLSLSGGAEDRTDENSIRNLMVGDAAPGVTSGLRLLDNLTDISILVVPGWSMMSDAVANTLLNRGISYCDRVRPSQARPLRDLFFVTNPPASVTEPTDARDYVRNTITTSSSGGHVALYYPWTTISDPIGTSSPTISIPPTGSIAGLYASIDGRRGVWKAPAGTEAGLAGITSLAYQVNDIKQDILNPHGVNVIRKMPGAGIVSWGARTLATNPEWKYVPVRRTVIMIEVSVYEGIQWAVFEPNDEPLWSSLRLNIGAFMMNLFRNGAFQGSIPEAAFFVKCDSETTTQNDIDLGKVNIHIGFAPLKPAEFVIVKISQKAGQTE